MIKFKLCDKFVWPILCVYSLLLKRNHVLNAGYMRNIMTDYEDKSNISPAYVKFYELPKSVTDKIPCHTLDI